MKHIRTKPTLGSSKYSAYVRISDVFGFFQSSFSAVVDSMVQSGRATSDEAALVREMKGRRENFGRYKANWPRTSFLERICDLLY
jgi:hypothetical protein